MTIFALMLSFIINFNNTGLTATTPGSYIEVVNVQYDTTANRTYGVLVRYEVDQNNSPRWIMQQLRSLPGKVAKADLVHDIVHDTSVTLVE